jgi:hypothetical protein
MKQRAITKRGVRQSSMTARRRRNVLPAVSRKTANPVSADGTPKPAPARRRNVGEAAGKVRTRKLKARRKT